MLDDHARAERLRQAPRTDVAMGARVFRFLSALQFRIVRELERIDPPARFASEIGGRVRISAGRVFAQGNVEVSVVDGPAAAAAPPAGGEPAPRTVTTGLTVDLQGVGPGIPSVWFYLGHTALGEELLHPEAQWFDGAARLRSVSPLGDAAVHFDGVWTRVCERHPGVVGVDRSGGGLGGAPLPHRDEGGVITGIRFERLGGSDPEGAFLFVREVGRAFLPACIPVLERSVTPSAD